MRYDRSVICDELPYLGTHEEPARQTRTALDHLYRTVADHQPPDDAEFYGNTVDALSHVTQARRERIDSAQSAIPSLLLVAVSLMSLVLIAAVSALDTKHRRWHITITTALSLIVAVNLWLVITLDRPFDGAASVSDAPLREGIPAAQLRCD